MLQSLLLRTLVVVLCCAGSGNAEDRNVREIRYSELGRQYSVLGKLGEPLGNVVKVHGTVVGIAESTVQVQRINGRATQQDIRLPLSHYFYEFGEEPRFTLGTVEPNYLLPKLQRGKTYEFEGFEVGSFDGITNEAHKRAGGRYRGKFEFNTRLCVYRAEQVERVRFSPKDFVNRVALIEGLATNADGKVYIVGDEWRLLLDEATVWDAKFENKVVEVRGTIRSHPKPEVYRLESGEPHLVKLEDQIGSQVALRGVTMSTNDKWWFEYRGNAIYIEGLPNLKNWSDKLRGEPILITGKLELTRREHPNPLSKSDASTSFIIRAPSWQRTTPLLSVEQVDGSKFK